MKHIFKSIFIASLSVLLLASPGIAQKKEKRERKEKMEKPEKMEKDEIIEKRERAENDMQEKQVIVITRDGRDEKKMVVEINDGKVTVNGKPMEEGENENVNVQVITMPDHGRSMSWTTPNGQTMSRSLTIAPGNMQLFSQHSNKALLGVVTETGEDGVKISDVQKESAAEKAGLKSGDVIRAIDEARIENPNELTAVIGAHKPGDKVVVQYKRDGKEMTTEAELGKWEGFSRLQSFAPGMEQEEVMGMYAPQMRLGQQYNIDQNRDYRREFRDGFNIMLDERPKLGVSVQDTEEGDGVEVIDVDEEGAGAKAGLKEGDIITGINKDPVKNADQVAAIVRDSAHGNSSMQFHILRDGKKQDLTVKMPKKLKTADL